MRAVLGFVGAMLFAAFGLVQLFIGFAGIDDRWGSWWAWAALIVAVLFRFTIPILVGVYLYATTVWGWSWWAAVLFALPGLAIMVPSVVAAFIGAVVERFRAKPVSPTIGSENLLATLHEMAARDAVPLRRQSASEAIAAADILDDDGTGLSEPMRKQ